MLVQVLDRRSLHRSASRCAVLLGLSLSGLAARALEIDPALLQEMQNKTGVESFDLFIALDRDIDVESLEAQLAASPRSRRELAIAALRDAATAGQQEVLQRLNASDLNGRVQRIRPLWVCNGIALRGDRTVIDALAALPVTGFVLQDQPLEMLERLPAANGAAELSRDELAAVETAKGTLVTWSVDYIGAPAVWDLGFDGSGVLVAHFDTGVWMSHPDIAQRIWTNAGEIAGNGLDDDQNGYIDDVHGFDFGDYDSDPSDDAYPTEGGGHGTHTAGSVAGDGTGGLHTGVAPGAALMVCKVTLSVTGLASTTAIWESWQYAVENGAQLLTMSMGLSGPVHASHLRSQRQVGDAMRLAGVTAFVAAGNAHGGWPLPYELSTAARVPSPWHPDPSVPYSSRSGIVAVGATAYQADEIWLGSSQGPADWGGVPPYSDWDYASGNGLVKPDVAAPGHSVSSLSRPTGYTGPTWSGTSMACPHAAGVAALLLQKNPSLSPDDIDRILQQSAVDAGVPGKDNAFGSGRIDALAAINAVPAAQLPSLVLESMHVLDQGGDGYFEPGELIALEVQVLNNSKTVDAAGVTLQLSCSDPLVQILDSGASFGAVAHGGSAANAEDGLVLAVDPAMTQGHRFDLLFTITANGGFSRQIDVALRAGLPELRTHEIGQVALTVTDRGTLGFWDDSQAEGDGFSHKAGMNGLFAGGLWAGSGPDYVCNRDYVSVDAGEWIVSETPNGRLRVPAIPLADEDFISVFSDGGHAAPRGIQITQHSMAYAQPGLDEFVVLRYEIFNTGNTIQNYYAGLFCDFDILYPLINNAAVDPGRRLSYMWDIDGNYYGIALLEPSTPAALALIPNADFSTAEAGFSDATKWQILSGALPPQSGVEERDYSSVVSAGPFSIPRTKTVTVAFALVYGDDLAALRANTDAAHARYAQIPTAAEDLPLGPLVRLEQNVPNPFNPTTSIAFTLAEPGPVELSVFDLRGRHTRTLVHRRLEAGGHVVPWDGRDDAGRSVASGSYFYRLRAGEISRTRKMVLAQ